MQNQAPTPAPSSLLPISTAYGEGRGVGGKFRKPSSRKTPSTPYDRPRSQQPPGENRGWLSKMMDPAYRLIAGRVNRFFPSLSSTPTPAALPPLTYVADRDGGHMEMATEIRNDSERNKINSCPGPSKLEGKLEVSGSAEDGQKKSRDIAGDSELSEIQKLIEGRMFTREEIDRLVELMQSRAVDLEQDTRFLDVNATEKVNQVEKHPGMSKKPIEGKADVGVIKSGTSTPLPQPTVREETSASPFEIARAYMGSRASKSGFGSRSLVSVDERLSLQANEVGTIALPPLPYQKSSTCWPGAIIEDHSAGGYSAPHGQGGKFGIHSFPRTPYSRMPYSKSKLTPLRGDSTWLPNSSSTPYQAMQAPLYGQSKANVDVESYGTVGPIRRMRGKYASQVPARGSTLSRFAQRSPLGPKESSDSDSLPMGLEPGAIGSRAKNAEVGSPSSHMTSNKVAREILDLISKPATPKDKSKELMLAVAQRNSYSSAPISTIPNEQTVLPQSRKDPLFRARPQVGKANDVAVAASDCGPSSMTSPNATSIPAAVNAGTSVNGDAPQMSSLFETTKTNDREVTEQLWPFNNKGKGLEVTTKHPSAYPHASNPRGRSVSSGSKPVLSSISVDKSRLQTTVAFDQSSGFTFPVSFSSGSLSEPPTPTVKPASPASSPPQPGSSSLLPTFSFGNKKSSQPMVFSFPSTSSGATPTDASDIKFKFGSDGQRISFSSMGEDAVVC